MKVIIVKTLVGTEWDSITIPLSTLIDHGVYRTENSKGWKATAEIKEEE